jgi:hypothetical protein
LRARDLGAGDLGTGVKVGACGRGFSGCGPAVGGDAQVEGVEVSRDGGVLVHLAGVGGTGVVYVGTVDAEVH